MTFNLVLCIIQNYKGIFQVAGAVIFHEMAQHAGFCDLSFESPRSSHLSKAEPWNIPFNFVTLSTRQLPSGWLNDLAR